MGAEKNSGYYDKIYTESDSYRTSVLQVSPYFALWHKVTTLISHDERVIDLGCGTGQFAKMCFDLGLNYVCGIDFSRTAIEVAIGLNPENADRFRIGCLLNYDNYTQLPDAEIYTCLEVLEHIENDKFIFHALPKGKRIIFSVPNYWDPSHVRVFDSIDAITARYGDVIDIISHTEHSFTPESKAFIVYGRLK